ncbi:MAG: AI-2E family transporter [Saprospiraceae bacterium]|nr:AI-2E family transporter [Saprospiraceae bacterium]MDG2419417.1 AI-2E family transporter [Saprospiraceae bacterium]
MNNWSRYIAIAISLCLVGAVFYYLSDIVAYVLIAWVLSMVGQPINEFYKEYLKLGSSGSAGLTLVTFIFLLTGLAWVFVPPMIKQAQNLAGIDYESLVESLEEPINSFNNVLVERGLMEGELIFAEYEVPEDTTIISMETIPDNIKKDTSQIGSGGEKNNQLTSTFVSIDSILLQNGDTVTKTNITFQVNINEPIIEAKTSDVIDKAAEIKHTDTPIEKIQKRIFATFNPGQIPQLFSTLIGFMGNLLIAFMSILFIAFFFLKEQGLFLDALQAIVPSKYEKEVIHALDDSSRLLRRYFVGVSIQVTTITIFVSLVLTVFGMKNALLIAFFAALINVIPYLGPVIGATFGVLITISSNLDLPFYEEMLPLIFIVIITFAAMQLLDNFVLQPFIFSNSVSAHPLEIFIVILVGAKLSGIVGMVLAIPVYTVIRVIAKSFLSEFRLVQKLTKKL